MNLKQAILTIMDRDTLKAVIDDLEIEGVDRRSAEEMRARVSRSRRAAPEMMSAPAIIVPLVAYRYFVIINELRQARREIEIWIFSADRAARNFSLFPPFWMRNTWSISESGCGGPSAISPFRRGPDRSLSASASVPPIPFTMDMPWMG